MELKRSSPARKKAAREVLLLCTTASISSEDKGRLSRILTGGVDWEYLMNLAEFHGIVPLVAHNLLTKDFYGQIPESYLDRLQRVYNSTLYRNVLFSTELANVLSAFSKRNIAVIPLKGTILAELLYGNPALRTIADMDILVHPEDLPQARSILAELGYKQKETESMWDHHFHEAPYYKQAKLPFVIELHWDLDDRRLVTIPEQEIWRRTQPLQLQGISAKILSPEDTLLFLTARFFRPSTEPLKLLSDINQLLRKYESLLDWHYITASTCSWQTEVATCYTLMRVKSLLKAPVPDSVLEVRKPGLWRRLFLGLLTNQEDLVTLIGGSKLRVWTFALVRGLVMKHAHQTLTVLYTQGRGKKGAWLRIAFWVMLVLVAAVWRNVTRIVSRQ